jgi:hypothetical protein
MVARCEGGVSRERPRLVRRPSMSNVRSGLSDPAPSQQESRSVLASLAGPGSQIYLAPRLMPIPLPTISSRPPGCISGALGHRPVAAFPADPEAGTGNRHRAVLPDNPVGDADLRRPRLLRPRRQAARPTATKPPTRPGRPPAANSASSRPGSPAPQPMNCSRFSCGPTPTAIRT